MTVAALAGLLLALSPDVGGLARVTHASGVLDLGEPFGERPLRLSGVRLRGMLGLSDGPWALDLHIVGEALGQTVGLGAGGDGFRFGESFRTAALLWVPGDGLTYRISVAVDRLHLRFDDGPWTVEVGRLPSSLATNRIFVPNDLFQPFAAQTFFRLYKPGVDAAIVRWSPGPLTRVEVHGVLGYRRAGQPAWDDPPDGDRSALLVRAGTAWLDLDWTVFGGLFEGRPLMALGVQGEILSWLEVGVEGQIRIPESGDPSVRASFGLGRQLNPDLLIRAEHLYQSDGADTGLERLAALTAPTGQGLVGPHLSGLSAVYQLHPLISVGTVVLRDWAGDAWLLAANATVSLLDESELALSASLPLGPGLDASGLPASELGVSPRTLTGEWRLYF